MVEKKEEMLHAFKDFTNLYELSKTLRFELRPFPVTRDNLSKKFGHSFLRDQDIEDAYQVLKPVLDALHEKFITESLQADCLKNIDFNDIFQVYKNKEEISDKEYKKKREIFNQAYKVIGEKWKNNAGKDEKGKDLLKENSFNILTEQGILNYIKMRSSEFADIQPKEKIEQALQKFHGFFTYFGGFNENRENYYTTDKEAATAVATRIVHENFPKFCDNIISFESCTEEYENIFSFLEQKERSLVTKDKKPLNPIDREIFSIEFYNRCFSQPQITQYNEKIGDANLLINLYNQAPKEEKNFRRLPLFKTLYKQIGCGTGKALFFTITHNTVKEAEAKRQQEKEVYSVEEAIHDAAKIGKILFTSTSNASNPTHNVPDFLSYIEQRENYLGVYWSKAAMNTISARYFANWHDLKDRLKKDGVFEKAPKGSEEEVKTPDAVELESLFKVLDETPDWKESFFKSSIQENVENKKIIDNSTCPSKALLTFILNDIKKEIQAFLGGEDAISKIDFQNADEHKDQIKQWMEHALAVNQVLKYFLVKEGKAKGERIDSVVSDALKNLLNAEVASLPALQDRALRFDWFKWYDALRNYLTKKPQDDVKENKLKLNFENSVLASGWDINKEPENFCIILENSEKKKFLAIVDKNNSDVFQKQVVEGKGKNKKVVYNQLYEKIEVGSWKKMEYDFWADVSKMIPKCSTQLKEVVEHFKKFDNDFIIPAGFKVASGEMFIDECKITKKQFELNNKVFHKDDVKISAMRWDLDGSEEKNYIKGFQKEFLKISGSNVLYRNYLNEWINFCKYFLSKYPKTKLFQYNFKSTEDYGSVDEFYLDVDKCSYRLKIDTKINSAILFNLEKEGKIYLFEIKNQDSNLNKKEGHKKNLHTLYWETIFEDTSNRPKLCGGAEIFYRKALPVDKQEKIIDKHGKEIIKNYRFSKEKFLFHVPITLNFCSNNSKINDMVKKKISPNNETCFLGIDRGEKHLAYYSLVDKNGVIMQDEQGKPIEGTLNMPFVDTDGNPRTITVNKKSMDKNGEEKIDPVECKDYNDLLEARSGNRDFARKNWQTIGTIKELKDGYVSHVVRKIVDLAVRYGAFIVLEDLNIGFKRGRQKIEKQVYQKLELAVAKKLNFLVDKDVQNGEVGSVTKALQLTPAVTNFGEMEGWKHFGLMLYTRADYTSQTDPATGWRKTIYLKKGSEENIRKQILEPGKFDDIRFDGKNYLFIYSDKNISKQWTLYSGTPDGKSLERYRGERGDQNEWTSTLQDINKILNGVFADFDKNNSIYDQFKNQKAGLKKIDDKHTAYETLRFAIEMIQQIRNTGTSERDSDFILSPVRDKNGNHFDSRLQNGKMPTSGDANGAYNIARKGILVNEHILRGYKLYISDWEWDAWLAGKETWEQWLKNHEKELVYTKKKNN